MPMFSDIFDFISPALSNIPRYRSAQTSPDLTAARTP